MKIGLMQPYFLPYLGYFQLIAAVDKFVVYDDVQYIRGWINHNFIWSRGGPQRIVLPLRGRSLNLNINQIQVLPNSESKLLKTIRQTYSKAPQFEVVMPLIEKILTHSNLRLSEFLMNSVVVICDYLELGTNILLSSSLLKTEGKTGQDRVIDICRQLEATEYINAPGGTSLYDPVAFRNQQICLSFLIPRKIEYAQYGPHFTPNLSILDVLMFNDRHRIRQLLREFDLLTPNTTRETDE